jgi:hypothetical protein
MGWGGQPQARRLQPPSLGASQQHLIAAAGPLQLEARAEPPTAAMDTMCPVALPTAAGVQQPMRR